MLMAQSPNLKAVLKILTSSKTGIFKTPWPKSGRRLADVFGADKVLWVEGRTEEACFPKILTGMLGRALFGTTILGVVNTGDFEGRRSDIILEVYERLSGATALLPPAIAFIFDAENRTARQCADLTRRRPGQVHFLPTTNV